MNGKVRVALLCGGKSAEHEVSLVSARHVYEALDKSKYDVVIIAIDLDGGFHYADPFVFTHERVESGNNRLAVVPGNSAHPIISNRLDVPIGPIDVILPILHGTCGEDGTVQGLAILAGVPFVGPGVLGSAVGMDKDVMKRLLRQAGIPVAASITLTRKERSAMTYAKAAAELGETLFIKPANMGSSVGIHKVCTGEDWEPALDDAFLFDDKILIEEAIIGREIECAVLGNEDLKASVPGEIIPTHDFYSYDAKYNDPNGARLAIPADVPDETIERVQRMAVNACRVLCCEGMARVDFFLTPDGLLLVNEINTIPGFTPISMYPKLWEATGIGYSELLDRLIELAMMRYARQRRLRMRYED